MKGIDSAKTIELLDTKSSSVRNKSANNNTKSSSFDSYLNNYSNNSVNKKSSYKEENDNKQNSSLPNDKSDDFKSKVSSKSSDNSDAVNKKDNYINKSEDSSDNKKSSVTDYNDDKSEEIDADINDIKKYCDDSGIDIEKMFSLILNAMNGNEMDTNKLKVQMDNLKIPENVQKDVINLVAKIQDILDGKANASQLLKQSFQDIDEHSKLIAKIVDVLKQKLNETSTSEFKEVITQNKLVNDKFDNSGNKDQSTDKLNPNQILEKKVVADSSYKQSNLNNKNEMHEDFANKKQYNTNSNLNSNVDDDQNALYSPKDILDEIKSSLKDNSDNKDSSANSGEKFLNKLLASDKNDNQFSKVTAFMNQFSNVNTNAEAVSGETPTINRATFVQDIIKSVKYMDMNNIKELTVKINPKELGEVLIKLTMENNQMKASIQTANKETYSLLRSSLADINAQLSNQNIKIQNFSVNIYDDTTYFSGQNGQKQNENNKENNSKNSNNSQYSNVDEVDDEISSTADMNSQVDILV